MKNVKALFTKVFILGLVFGLTSQLASAQGMASPPAEASGTIDGVSVTINYHSPGVKGRTIFGDLEDWGNVWRAGANNATTIEFSEDVKINGNALPKGKYAFFIIPKEEGDWTIIFNKTWDQWGAFDYNSGEDALRVDVTPQQVDLTERLKYTIEGNTIAMTWEKTKVPFTVSK